ncbi:MAG: UDP-N-acetylglucosamine 1-carboxyvinyltransferase [Alphaproteobacteria bacterium]|nr:UDP-N-acetylglucosamine 1-carboxyvinyltransferase [Alphaproteobacteria bacterium]
MNNIFQVQGGLKLKGNIQPQGSKNECLQILCAVLLTNEPITINNLPNIIDVNVQIELLASMGVEISEVNGLSKTFCAKNIDPEYIFSKEFSNKGSKLRGSILFAGPMLARFKKALIPKPGGDKIGRRRLDTHILNLEKLGAKYLYYKDLDEYLLQAETLVGASILLDEPSVTGTANVIMAAVLAEGKTTIYNAACEPYIQQLCRLLNTMGAKISGIGSNLLQIEGVLKLHTASHTILPDMIEIGSFIGLAALTQSDITIKNCGLQHLGIIPEKFKQLGIHFVFNNDDIHVPAQDKYTIQTFLDGGILTIYDHPWPGFTPDLLSILLVTATQAEGCVLIHQKMFESRLFFVDNLINMGAKIILCDPHRATVIGLNRGSNLRGISMNSPDIRAGQALLLAALAAEGTSTIRNIHQIDRGYQNIDGRLNELGADIKRI